MSAEKLDDSAFLLHFADLAAKQHFISPEMVGRLQRMADLGVASPAALREAHLRGFDKGVAHERARLFAISHMPGDDLDMREVGEAPVMIVMSRGAATEARDTLADILCWCRGFVAALPDNPDRHPMGWEVARDLRDALRRALNASE